MNGKPKSGEPSQLLIEMQTSKPTTQKERFFTFLKCLPQRLNVQEPIMATIHRTDEASYRTAVHSETRGFADGRGHLLRAELFRISN